MHLKIETEVKKKRKTWVKGEIIKKAYNSYLVKFDLYSGSSIKIKEYRYICYKLFVLIEPLNPKDAVHKFHFNSFINQDVQMTSLRIYLTRFVQCWCMFY